jgi:putative salt-induced outer membrane protein YdiY
MAAQIVFFVRPFFNQMKKLITIIIIAARIPAVFADTSTNGVVQEKKSPWESNASLGFTLTRGNSDTSLFTAKVFTSRKDDFNEWLLGADGAYGENSGVENADSLHGFGQWNHLFSEKFFSYMRVDALHDGIAGIKYRVTIGPGAGYYLLKETNTTLSAEAGCAEVIEQRGTSDNSYATLRLAEKFEHKFAEHGARVWQTFEILPQVDNFNNYIINAEIGIEAGIARNLSLQSYIDDSFDNQPAFGRLRNDVKLVTGISYKF